MASDMRLGGVVAVTLALSACGGDSGGDTSTGVSVTMSAGATEDSSGGSSISSTVSATSQGTGEDTGVSDSGSSGSASQTEGGTLDDSGSGAGSGSGDGSGSGSGDGSGSGEESSGESGGGGGDQDDDGLPDGDDPFPMDPDLPGFVQQFVIYAHTAATLYTMDVEAPYAIAMVGNFSFPQGGNGSMTDIAIDRWGVLYGITFDNLHVCNPATAECYDLGVIGESSNGMTFLPPGVIDPADDALIGIANSGSWRHMELVGNMVNMMVIGGYGVGYTSSGDAFSIENVGTYGSVDAAGNFNDVIVEVDPMDGSVIDELATLTGYSSTYGLAGWEGAIFAFDESGDVLLVDPADGSWEVINMTNQSWWGAGVGTVIPQ